MLFIVFSLRVLIAFGSEKPGEAPGRPRVVETRFATFPQRLRCVFAGRRKGGFSQPAEVRRFARNVLLFSAYVVLSLASSGQAFSNRFRPTLFFKIAFVSEACPR